jgi:hypothetical protein
MNKSFRKIVFVGKLKDWHTFIEGICMWDEFCDKQNAN